MKQQRDEKREGIGAPIRKWDLPGGATDGPIRREILDRFSFYRDGPEELRKEIEAATTPVIVPEGRPVFRNGDRCDKILFMGRGDVRVFKTGDNGREITLYHLYGGEGCILNVACVVAGIPYPADSVVLRQVEAVAAPPEVFLGWTESRPEFRSFVGNLLATRFVSLMMRIEEVALDRMDRRLAKFLLTEARRRPGALRITHEKIASELGSAREVVSRLLKEFERRGRIRMTRGRVEVVDEGSLRHLVAEPPEKH